MSIECNGQNGIRFKQGIRAFSQVVIKRIRMDGFVEGIDIQDFCYFYVQICSFYAAIDYKTINNSVKFGIRAGTGKGTRKFLYIENTAVDAGAGDNANLDMGVTGNAVEIYGTNNIYIKNCDFANWGNGAGLYVSTVNSYLFGVFMDNLNVIRSSKGIVISK